MATRATVPSGLGREHHVSIGTTSIDALLWAKHPGGSDGSCTAAPARAGGRHRY
ncbi:glycoside hydrolase family 6 protein [Glaciihabitans sp. GrIS 2.15]|uniref:glycoside hydrolase family 6 protein n=1 Tax=Glaciihabitans sp. GrIS 2.15 TaxID=3071710 RepID=UPI003FA3B14A